MSRAVYSGAVGAGVALVTATSKTVLTIITPATFGADLLRFRIGFDGVTASDKAVAVELMTYTADGTGTAGSINQTSGRTITAGFTTKYNYSVEPTGGVTVDTFSLTPIGGTVLIDFGDNSPDTGVSTLFGLRCTAPTNPVNVRATMWVARC
jgi:hypothetical protein